MKEHEICQQCTGMHREVVMMSQLFGYDNGFSWVYVSYSNIESVRVDEMYAPNPRGHFFFFFYKSCC